MRSKFSAADGSPSASCTFAATDGSRCVRVTDVLISRPMSAAATPDSASAFAPASMAASSNAVPASHQRRSCTPATRWSKPRGRRNRRRLAASCSSNQVDGTITGACRPVTASSALPV